MLILQALKWDNCFSYGDDNYIDLTKEPLTQLTGPNGAGKTSISLIIQEILYGKNSKNVKKQDISNNKTGKNGYNITIWFEKDGNNYKVDLKRTTGLKLKLFKNDEDISSHTALNTYKTISDIIGIADFKVFCQLIYQHSTDSLDFLTATDTNRKKFLISLLQLAKYLELHEKFKTLSRDINKNIATVQGSINTINSWIQNHKDIKLIKQTLVDVPELPEELLAEIAEVQDSLNNINSVNRKINDNNQYKAQLAALDSKYYLGSAPQLPNPSSQELRAQVRVLESNYSSHVKKIENILNLERVCHECRQEIPEKKKQEMYDEACVQRDKVMKRLEDISIKIPEAEIVESEIKKYKNVKLEFERLSQLIDNGLPSETLDKDDLTKRLSTLKSKALDIRNKIKEANDHNNKVSEHNSKVDIIKEQLDKMNKDLMENNIKLTKEENLLHIVEILKKVFSTNGLVSYKIESSVKELEKKINKYLAELTNFQIYFKLAGEKLNIEVVDDFGNVTSISNLSSGERARINICCVLSIRSILSSLTSTKINFLCLDEVIGVIDAEGKEKLAEILLRENLNTFIVSHDWTHPLVPKINIIKENDISRIEYD